MLPLVNNVVLSVNDNAPPTVILPAVLLPMMMLLKPSFTTEPPNTLAATDKVPLPEPKPIVVPVVYGFKTNAPDDAKLPVSDILSPTRVMSEVEAVMVEPAFKPT